MTLQGQEEIDIPSLELGRLSSISEKECQRLPGALLAGRRTITEKQG